MEQQKVLWTEGMFLTPHHFQQWDRYYENLLNQRMRAQAPLGWGVNELTLNEEALDNGQFSINRVHAILPDGMVVNAPETDEVPAARDIGEHFGADTPRNLSRCAHRRRGRRRPGARRDSRRPPDALSRQVALRCRRERRRGQA